MKIHETAIVDPSSEIHESVEIGPYSIIEKNVKIGEGTKIGSCARIYSGVRLGKGNQIFHGCILGGDPQDLSFDTSKITILEIGDNNIFRETTNISRPTNPDKSMRIGSNNMLMCNAHIGHDANMGDHCILAPSAAVGGHVHIGNRVFISGLVAVHQFCRIGDYGMAAGLAKITKDIPPFCTVDGNPAGVVGVNAVGIRRAGFGSDVRRSIQNAYKVIYHSDLVTNKAIERLKSEGDRIPEVDYIIRFFEETKRGVTEYSAYDV